MQVVKYDALTVTARYGTKADVTLAEGWPYVAVTARKAMTATLTSAVGKTATAGLFTASVNGTTYAVVAPTGSVGRTKLTLAKGQRAVLFAIPAGVSTKTMVAGAKGVVTSGSVTSALHAKTAATTLKYTTVGGKPTVLASLPFQQTGGAHCEAGSVPSISGTMHLCTGTKLSFAVARRTATNTLPVSNLSAAKKATIRSAIAKDVAATPAEPADSYGGGKWLYRLANLLQLANQTGDTKAAATVRAKLDAALEQWADPKGCATRATHCFVYDPTIKGIVGHQASYGSDQFNDHHFHYGYILSAAAIAVADRPALKAKLAPVMNLLAADIASTTASSKLPADRTFDAYAGHSWASGYSPFADGNDEESSSEAVNAWNGVTLWAKATGDTSLAAHGTWLLSNEIATARTDWLYPNLTAFTGFDHAFVSLNWGGKRDSATWFSADPAAKLAIQLIPMSPVSTYTKASAAKMAADLKEAKSSHTTLFADYLLMYARLGGMSEATALAQLQRIPAASIDGANSRAYATAWILTK
jgi:endo-1,3(4)-beta-glucanase